MVADRKWLRKTLLRSDLDTAAPDTFSVSRVAKAAVKPSTRATPEDFQREIIDFDSEGPVASGSSFSTATGIVAPSPTFRGRKARAKDRPKTERHRQGPAAEGPDVLLVTWTVDEGHALSRVLRRARTRATTMCPTRTISRRSPRKCARVPALQANGSAPLDHDDRQQVGGGVQVGLPHVAGRRSCRTSTSGARSSSK